MPIDDDVVSEVSELSLANASARLARLLRKQAVLQSQVDELRTLLRSSL